MLPGDARNASSLGPATSVRYGELAVRRRLYWDCACHRRLRAADLAPLDWQCSAGISERAYAIWALASALFLGHSIVISDAVFMVTQLVNIVALAIILVLARRFRNQICAAHARQLHVEGEGLHEQPKYSH